MYNPEVDTVDLIHCYCITMLVTFWTSRQSENTMLISHVTPGVENTRLGFYYAGTHLTTMATALYLEQYLDSKWIILPFLEVDGIWCVIILILYNF